MKLLCIAILFTFWLAGLVNSADAQGTVTSVSCGNGLTCTPNPITSTGSIQAPAEYIPCVNSGPLPCSSTKGFDVSSFSADQFVYVQGYNQPGDGGGGTFANMGTCTSSNPANGGTILQDDSSPNQYCFRRLDPNWGAKEYGAYGDGMHNDWQSLKAWLNTNQPHIGDAGMYGINKGLTCGEGGANTTIQGPDNLDNGGAPIFQIEALSGYTGTAPVIDALGYCRLSGVAINANNISGIDTVHADGHHVTIDGFSVLENGVNNLVCNNSDLAVKDTILTGASNDNFQAVSNCANARLVGDIFQGATGTNVVLNTDEAIIADGVIETARGPGLDLTGAHKVSVSAMHIQGNGWFQNNSAAAGSGAGIIIKNANTISICGNHLEGNGGANGTNSSQIYFAGQNDNIDFCANAYETQSLTDVTLRPSYVYDASSNATLTNSHLFESAPPQAAGAVYSANAALILPQLHVPLAVGSDFSGLILSNDLVVKSEVDVTSGKASDSTNTSLIQLPQNSSSPAGGCTVDLASNGVGGLDTGSLTTNTTYFYFVIAGAFGANPACMASASPTPTFVNAGSAYSTPPSGPSLVTGSTISASSTYLYNVSSVVGMAVNNPITDTCSNCMIQAGTTISNIGTLTVPPCTSNSGSGSCSIGNSGGTTTVYVPSVANIATGMAVSDQLPTGGCTVPASALNGGGFTVASVNGTTLPYSFTLNTTASTESADCITVSGGNTITLSKNAANSQQNKGVIAYNGLYRMIGTLYTYTNGAATQVIPFTQDNDRFYLNNPVLGINSGITTSAANYTVAGIPTGISVGALGRCIGSGPTVANNILIFTPTTAPASAPAVFPTAPGYSFRTTNTSVTFSTTAFPYQLDTNTSAQIAAQTNGSSSTLQCMTDGWVFHRGG